MEPHAPPAARHPTILDAIGVERIAPLEQRCTELERVATELRERVQLLEARRLAAHEVQMVGSLMALTIESLRQAGANLHAVGQLLETRAAKRGKP